MVNDINNINAPQSGTTRNSGSDAVSNDSVDNRASGQRPASTTATDTVELSSQAQDLNRIQQSLRTLPDVDEARVSEVRERIASGNFILDAEQIAASILANDQSFSD